MTIRLAGDDGRGVVVKALRRGGLLGRIRGGYYGHDRLLAEIAAIEESIRRGVPTPPAAFGASARLPGGRQAALLATLEIEGAVSLAELLRSAASVRRPGKVPVRARNTSLARAGLAVRRAHDLGLDHADLNIGNVLVAPLRRPVGIRGVAADAGGASASIGAYVIDFGISKIGEPLGTAARARGLVRLLRSAEKHLESDPRRARDAAAFLHGYLAAGAKPDRAFRRRLLRATRRRLPVIRIHQLGWAIVRYFRD